MMLEVKVKHCHSDFCLDVSFQLSEGITAITGVSGSGKTSLINIISGIVNPDEGRIKNGDQLIFDSALAINTPPHLRRIGYIFQDARLFPHLTVAQNLRYGEFFTKKNERHHQFSHIIELLGIEHFLSRRPAKLSGGEKQRVAIGRALLMSPKLILADEPLASLDQARKEEILPYFIRLRDELKVPMIYVTHAKSEAKRLANQLITLENGKIISP